MHIEEVVHVGQEGLLIAQVETAAVPLSKGERDKKEGSAIVIALYLNGKETPEELLDMIVNEVLCAIFIPICLNAECFWWVLHFLELKVFLEVYKSYK